MKATELQASESKREYDIIFESLLKEMADYVEIPIKVHVLIGSRMVKIRELLELETGSIIDLKRSAGESLIITLNDTFFAKGEVTVIEDTFGVRITEINDPRKV